MEITQPTRTHISPLEDSRRWKHLDLRPDDIIISTPPKCGTTWTQRIVMSLLWPNDDAPSTLNELSPWLDFRLRPIDERIAQLDAQQHRRFIKTHSPAGTIPFSPSVRYLAVFREPADALVSWGNHCAKMRPEVVDMINETATAAGVALAPITFDGDYDELVAGWTAYWSPAIHLAPWWPLRHEPNVLLVHYSDLYADLDGGMRRIADFLDLTVPNELWSAAVDRCTLDAMRSESSRTEGEVMNMVWDGGAAAFFHQGGDGRGKALLSEEQLAAIDAHHRELLPPDAYEWLTSGGLSP